ncbi:hypothetical protein EAO75_13895 [Streptomyces sp. uw30]|nr:hypothetical protein EAO75_13895 [Streptomyces sp. uw30]
MVYLEDLVADPRYAPELLPPLVTEYAAHAVPSAASVRTIVRRALFLPIPPKGSRVAWLYRPRHRAPSGVRVPSLPTPS